MEAGARESPPAGPLLFARYAYPPNALGYCGPDDHAALLEYAAAQADDGGLRPLARRFDGAWPYLELIAHQSGVGDPLDARVVEAYWVGNDLLRNVRTLDFGNDLADRFRLRTGPEWEQVQDAVPAGLPHHSFHVFCVYPWVGLLRSGRVDEPLQVLDRCRIRWGRVMSVDGDRAVVESRPLTWDGLRLGFGEPRPEVVQAASDGASLAPWIEAGNLVAMHWDWVCDRLTPGRLADLRRYTGQHLRLANQRPLPA